MGILWALILTTVVISIWAFFAALKKLPKTKSVLKTNIRDVQEWIRFSLPVFGESMLTFFVAKTGIEILILGVFVSNEEIGIYGALYRLFPFMMFPALAFSSAFGPVIAELVAKNHIGELKRHYSVVSRWVSILVLPLFFVILFAGRDILKIYGNRFESGYIALIILACGYLVDSSVGEVRSIVLMTGRSFLYFINILLMTIINFGLCFLLVPKYGIVGAAISAGISRAFLNIIGLVQAYYFFKIHPFTRDYFKPFIAATISFLFVVFTSKLMMIYAAYGTEILYVRIILTVSIYFSVLVLLGLSEEEKSILLRCKSKITNSKRIWV